MPGFNIDGSGLNQPNNTQETHRVHRFIIENFGFPESISGSGTRTRTQAGLNVYAKTASLPTVGFETQTAPGASIDYPYAAKATFEPVIITFYDVLGMYKLFDQWRSAIWTPEEGIKPINEYAGNPVIAKTDGQGNVTERFTLRNAFPKQLSQSDLTYESSDISLVKVTFVYSHFDYENVTEQAQGFSQ